MRSVIFTLVDPVKFVVLNRNLPDNAIRITNRETLNPSSFPGWPSFGDLLCDAGSKTVVGMAFHVPPENRSIAARIARKLSPAIVHLVEPGKSEDSAMYAMHPVGWWLELKWSSVPANQLMSVQSCDTLWYPSAAPADERIPIAFGIEHLEELVKAADYDLSVPDEFPFPPTKLEFLND